MTRPPTSFKLLGPQKAMYGNAATYNLMIAGQGSGKSHDIGIRSALFLIYCPNVIGIIAANTYDQLSRATLFRAFETWRDYFGWSEYDPKKNPDGFYVIGKEPPAHFKPHGYTFKSNNNNIYFANGGVIFTASLENYTGIEGIEIGWALLDETADTREEALTSVITGRLRQKGLSKCSADCPWYDVFPFCQTKSQYADGEINPLFVYTKPAKEPWLNDLFKLDRHREEISRCIYDHDDYFYHFDGIRQIVIYSTFWNAENLPETYLRDRIALLEGTGLIDSHVYGNPFSKTGGEFVFEFDRKKHEKPCTYEDGYPLHFTIDFNAKPYMSGLAAQLVGVTEEEKAAGYWGKLRVFDEYALKWPRNTAGHLAEQFVLDYEDKAAYGLYIYGDASGNNEVPVKGAKSYFEDFTNNLTIGYELRVPAQNPRYEAALGKGSMGRKAFVNKIMSGSFGIIVEIDPRCKELLSDMEFVMEDANGRMLKKKNKDGVEERGHHLDGFQYLICHPKFLGYLAKDKLS